MKEKKSPKGPRLLNLTTFCILFCAQHLNHQIREEFSIAIQFVVLSFINKFQF